MEKDTSSLLEKVRNGDEGAFDILAEEYNGLTESSVKRFMPSFDIADGTDPMCGADDLRQYASIALYKAAVSYDPDAGKNVSFGLYAKICINNALITVLRKYKSEQKRQRKMREKAQRPSRDPLAELVGDEETDELVTRIKSELSEFEKAVLDLYVTGRTVHEIAQELGREEKSVSNALYRMKVKIKGLLKK